MAIEIINRHINRVIDAGADTSKINASFLDAAGSFLTTYDRWKNLMWWVDPRFGVKFDGSGFVSRVFCLGTTRLPRGGDYTPTTSNTWPSTSSNTSYSATGFRGTTPAWVNNATSAHGYFGNGIANNIQRKNKITLIAAYQKPGTAIASLFGYGQNCGMYLQHAAGSTGNVIFGLATRPDQPASFTTATAAFTSATNPHVVVATHDGATMNVILDGVAGTSADSSALNNSDLTGESVLRGLYSTANSQTLVLASGGQNSIQTLATRAYNIDNHALFSCSCLAVFDDALSSSESAAFGALYA